MAQPRRSSRPDRRIADFRRRSPGNRRHAAYLRLEGTAERSCDGDRVDPGRLIETAFRARDHADDPETLLLAWLTCQLRFADVPHTAAALRDRLVRVPPALLAPWQRRLVHLLEFVAKHGRRAPACSVASPLLDSNNRKGMS